MPAVAFKSIRFDFHDRSSNFDLMRIKYLLYLSESLDLCAFNMYNIIMR
nr:MAG TPA: hypothetical protein [Caudoviricetes sp.]